MATGSGCGGGQGKEGPVTSFVLAAFARVLYLGDGVEAQ